jgi:hypothetical protein
MAYRNQGTWMSGGVLCPAPTAGARYRGRRGSQSRPSYSETHRAQVRRHPLSISVRSGPAVVLDSGQQQSVSVVSRVAGGHRRAWP